MTADFIIQEISKLPLPERLLVVKQTLRSIRQDRQRGLAAAADLLGADYLSDPDLTAFTRLDADAFYEAR